MVLLAARLLVFALLGAACSNGIGGSPSSRATDPKTPPAPTTAASAVTPNADTLYEVTFAVDQVVLTAGQSVHGIATLKPLLSDPRTISAASTGPFGFRFSDGQTDIEPAWPGNCRSYNVSRSQPLTSPIVKSGSFVLPTDAAPINSFFAGPDIMLAPGTWTVTAIAIFADGPDCGSAFRRLEKSVDVVVR